MSPVLQLNTIRKSYYVDTPIETEVLHGISLTLESGSFSALTGPSGSGKSTLLNIIGLLERATQGELIIAGQSTQQLNDAQITQLRGRHIGFIFQFHHLLPAFTALENIMMPAIIHNLLPKKQAQQHAQQLLESVGLASFAHKKSTELSGGMQQRVAIARALMHNPPLILADEPTGNLDTHAADSIFQLLQRINQEQGTSFIIVTHDENLAKRCTSRFHLVDGQLTTHPS